MGITRFRAYQLGEAGSSFSYCHEGHFTLIEARITKINAPIIIYELENFSSNILSSLHISSWDKDHCDPDELSFILEKVTPNKVECPGYMPENESGKQSFQILSNYTKGSNKAIAFTPKYIDSLDMAKNLQRNDVILWPRAISNNKQNDNSTAKIFRQGHFTVLSLGDLESYEIAKIILNDVIVKKEIDIMILAHHGADNGFTCQEFINAVKPTVAICTSNYDSQYDHPRNEIRNLLDSNRIPLYTTKTGDVIIQNLVDDFSKYKVINLQANSTEISTEKEFFAKTY